MHHRNLSSEIIRLRRGLDLPFTPAEEAQQAQRDLEVPRDRVPTAPVSAVAPDGTTY
jgi:hypothetical protein